MTHQKRLDRCYALADTFDDALERPGLKLIHVNRSPFITTAKAMTEDNAARLGLDLKRLLRQLQSTCQYARTRH